jgi:hypothetical protein
MTLAHDDRFDHEAGGYDDWTREQERKSIEALNAARAYLREHAMKAAEMVKEANPLFIDCFNFRTPNFPFEIDEKIAIWTDGAVEFFNEDLLSRNEVQRAEQISEHGSDE